MLAKSTQSGGPVRISSHSPLILHGLRHTECHNSQLWQGIRLSKAPSHRSPYTYTSNGLGQWLPTHRIYHLPAVTANPSSGAFFNGVDWHGMVQGANCCWLLLVNRSPQGSLLDVLWSRDYLRKVRFTVDLIFFEWFWFSIYFIYSIYIYILRFIVG